MIKGYGVVRRAALLLVMILFSPVVVSASVEQGYQWLSAAQQGDGSLYGNSESAHRYQATAEALLAQILSQGEMSLDLSAAQQYLVSISDPSTEVLSRQLMLVDPASSSEVTLRERLLLHQNADGGFGSYEGYDSNVVDTAAALASLARYRSGFKAHKQAAFEFLAAQQFSVGSFPMLNAEQSSYALSAVTALSLQQYVYDFGTAAEIAVRARDYLLAEMSLRGDQLSNWELALGLLAIMPLLTDTALYTDQLAMMRARQGADGSWGQDVFSTALAVRVLQMGNNVFVPPSSAAAQLRGRVLDEETGGPVQGVRIGLSGANAVFTDGMGRFSINELSAGSYSLTASAGDYFDKEREVVLVGGEINRIADIQVQKILGASAVVGRISDGTTGEGVFGADIYAGEEGASVTASSAATGSYRMVVAAGDVELGVSAQGYDQIVTRTSVPLGGQLIFSPVLYPVGTSPQFSTTIVKGRVVDAETQSPILGGIIDLGASVAITDAFGKFEIESLSGSAVALNVGATGYQTVESKIHTPSNSISDLGDVPLVQMSAPPASTNAVIGLVTDVQTGLPVSGARISVSESEQTVLSADDGSYLLSGVSAVRSTVKASATGYFSKTFVVNFEAFDVLELDFNLMQVDISGLVVDGFGSEQANYPAFSQAQLRGRVTNIGAALRHVRPVLQILDAEGAIIASPSLADTIGAGGPDQQDTIVLAPGQEYEFISGWFTGTTPPGVYQLKLIGLDGNTGQKLFEETSSLAIVPTVDLSNLTLRSNHTATHVGATETLRLSLSGNNRSNQVASFRVEVVATSPSGMEFPISGTMLTIEPSETYKSFELGTYIFSVVEVGDYVLRGITESLPTDVPILPVTISVAPSVRINANQTLSPAQVAPADSQRVHVDIQLEGVGE